MLSWYMTAMDGGSVENAGAFFDPLIPQGQASGRSKLLSDVIGFAGKPLLGIHAAVACRSS